VAFSPMSHIVLVITAGVLFYVAMTDFGAPEKPHAHGTGMAGAIASHQRLLGTAPAAPG
jgi:hypothetical protein